MGKFVKKSGVDLSIVIVSYNTKELLEDCIRSIQKTTKKIVFEIIVVDNASSDGSWQMVENLQKEKVFNKSLIFIKNKENIGFSKGNNLGVKVSSGRYLLFLNPDTVVYENTLFTMVNFMNEHEDAGAATCDLVAPTGGIDEASHRGFPTPWNAFCHFSGLEKTFPKSRIFAGYTQGWKNLNEIHTVDSITGAFMIVRRSIGEKLGWWDEDYFFYGEDLDFCYKIRKEGLNIYYIPTVSVLHYGGISSGIKKISASISTADNKTKLRAQNARFDAMRIFYKKHYVKVYPEFVNWLVLKGINYLHKKNISKLVS